MTNRFSGRAVARGLIAGGARVALLDRGAEGLARLAGRARRSKKESRRARKRVYVGGRARMA